MFEGCRDRLEIFFSAFLVIEIVYFFKNANLLNFELFWLLGIGLTGPFSKVTLGIGALLVLYFFATQ